MYYTFISCQLPFFYIDPERTQRHFFLLTPQTNFP